MYRALRALEREGAVRSAWAPSEEGPHRRIYTLTRPGMQELHRRAKAIVRGREALDVFLGRYEEFVSLRRQNEPARSRG